MNKNQMRKYVRETVNLEIECFRCFTILFRHGESLEDLWEYMRKRARDWKVTPDGPVCPSCAKEAQQEVPHPEN